MAKDKVCMYLFDTKAYDDEYVVYFAENKTKAKKGVAKTFPNSRLVLEICPITKDSYVTLEDAILSDFSKNAKTF